MTTKKERVALARALKSIVRVESGHLLVDNKDAANELSEILLSAHAGEITGPFLDRIGGYESYWHVQTTVIKVVNLKK